MDYTARMNAYLYLLVVNALTALLYWHDKRAAKKPGAARVPEALLLGLGFLGGTGAALIAQRLLRHKTRKRSFQFKFWTLTFLQIGLLIFPPPVLSLILSRAFD